MSASHRLIRPRQVDAAEGVGEVLGQADNCPDLSLRNATQAVEMATAAVALKPQADISWNTLGVARYRVGNWPAAIEALTKSEEMGPGKTTSFNGFFLAMAHWRLDHKEKAREWYDQAVAWMDKNQPQDKELLRFRAEAAELLGIKEGPK